MVTQGRRAHALRPFRGGEQVGEWTTYDKAGVVYKVTTMKPKKGKAPA
jgi:hypothetical protein